MRHKGLDLQNRKGAILVLTAFALITLLMLFAFTVDIGRIYIERSELQVGADAGAHAGAITLSQGLNQPSSVVSSAVQFADSNTVFGQLVALPNASVACGKWDPTNRAFTQNTGASACGNADDAVQVTRNSAEAPLFAAILKHTAGTVSTKAVAWVAPTVSGTSCIKPLAIDYKILIADLNSLRTPPSSDPYRALDSTDFRILRTSASQLKFCVKDGPPGGQTCPNTGLTPGSFGIIGLVPGDGGGNNYTKELGADCSTPVIISAGDNVDVITGGKVGPTSAGVQNFCQTRTPCVMKVPLYNGTSTVTGPNATDGKTCGGGSQGTAVCYSILIVGAAVIDYPALANTPPGAVTGHFVLALDPGAVIGGTTKGLLSKIILVQ